jgi:hypothetical protein
MLRNTDVGYRIEEYRNKWRLEDVQTKFFQKSKQLYTKQYRELCISFSCCIKYQHHTQQQVSLQLVRFQVLTAANMKMIVFWDIVPSSVVMMEAVSTSETSVNFYQTIRRNIPKDRHLFAILWDLMSSWRWRRRWLSCGLRLLGRYQRFGGP